MGVRMSKSGVCVNLHARLRGLYSLQAHHARDLRDRDTPRLGLPSHSHTSKALLAVSGHPRKR